MKNGNVYIHLVFCRNNAQLLAVCLIFSVLLMIYVDTLFAYLFAAAFSLPASDLWTLIMEVIEWVCRVTGAPKQSKGKRYFLASALNCPGMRW